MNNSKICFLHSVIAGTFIDWLSPGRKRQRKSSSDSWSTPASKTQIGEKPLPFSITCTMVQQLGMVADLPENDPE